MDDATVAIKADFFPSVLELFAFTLTMVMITGLVHAFLRFLLRPNRQ